MFVRSLLALAPFAAAVTLALPSSAQPPVSLGAPHPTRPHGVYRRVDPTQRFHSYVTPQCNNPTLPYGGGPIVQAPVVVSVYWNSDVNAQVQASMGQFYTDLMNSAYFAGLAEYGTVGIASGTNQAILPGTVVSATIVPLKCPAGSGNCGMTESDLEAELARQIGLGVLPAPALDCTGNVQTIYMVEIPPLLTLTGSMGMSCANGSNGYCGFHLNGTYAPTGRALLYSVLTDQFTGPCMSGCGSSATPLENMTQTASHEFIESVTDPSNPNAWYDQNNSCGEIGDICSDGGAGDTITVSGRTWTVQQMWSNSLTACTSTGTVLPVCDKTTLTGCRRCSCGDDGVACGAGTPVCETTSSNALFGACEACTSKSVVGCAAGDTCLQSSTPASDDVCSGGPCLPKTCLAAQVCGPIGDGCGGVVQCGTCPGTSTCNAQNQCLTSDGGLVDASVTDASGAHDATHDAVAATPDAATTDTGTTGHDSGAVLTGNDAATGGVGAGQSGGCGCRAASRAPTGARWWMGLVPVALAARRQRRSR